MKRQHFNVGERVRWGWPNGPVVKVVTPSKNRNLLEVKFPNKKETCNVLVNHCRKLDNENE
jgi:hypothetical protein